MRIRDLKRANKYLDLTNDPTAEPRLVFSGFHSAEYFQRIRSYIVVADLELAVKLSTHQMIDLYEFVCNENPSLVKYEVGHPNDLALLNELLKLIDLIREKVLTLREKEEGER